MPVSGELTAGALLRHFRIRADKRQTELADLLGVHRNTVGNWERELLQISPDYVPKLARILRLSKEEAADLLLATQRRFEYDTQISQFYGEDDAKPEHERGSVVQGALQKPELQRHDRSRQFHSLIEEHTRNFVGRTYIFRAIEKHISDEAFGSGYVVIRGEPGIGKTALVAKLVKDHGYIHHFNISSQNIRTPRDFLGSICAQLIDRYGLAYSEVPARALRDGGFLQQLLAEAASTDRDEPIRILVDALDEAEDVGLPAGVNRLYLPEVLPDGVFMIVTSRPELDYRFRVDRRQDIHIGEDDPDNDEDVRQYIRRFIYIHREEMVPRIADWRMDEYTFVEVMLDKSEGNFMYLRYVLDDVRTGRISSTDIDDIRNLPTGLRAYYRQHWAIMKAKDPERFVEYYEPVVCMLATVREPVSLEQVAEWTKLHPQRVNDVIEAWYQFLNDATSPQGEKLFRLYHASFRDYLEEEIGLRSYHKMITDSALDILRS